MLFGLNFRTTWTVLLKYVCFFFKYEKDILNMTLITKYFLLVIKSLKISQFCLIVNILSLNSDGYFTNVILVKDALYRK